MNEVMEDISTNSGPGYLIITNISKKANIKALIAAAAAHRFVPVLVGEPNITEQDCCLLKPANKSTMHNTKTANNASISVSSLMSLPDDDVMLATKSAVEEGADSSHQEPSRAITEVASVHALEDKSHHQTTECEYISVLRCDTTDQLMQYLAERGVPLVGIEIMDNARSILADDAFPITFPATSNTTYGDGTLMPESIAQSTPRIAFMPGNEGTGLSTVHKALCNGQFVYIPHYGAGDCPPPSSWHLTYPPTSPSPPNIHASSEYIQIIIISPYLVFHDEKVVLVH